MHYSVGEKIAYAYVKHADKFKICISLRSERETVVQI